MIVLDLGLDSVSLAFGLDLDLASTLLRLRLDSILTSPGPGLDDSLDYIPTVQTFNLIFIVYIEFFYCRLDNICPEFNLLA